MTPDQYRTHREQLGLTQAGLARFLQIARETVARRENGSQKIGVEAGLAITALRKRARKQKRVSKQNHEPSGRPPCSPLARDDDFLASEVIEPRATA